MHKNKKKKNEEAINNARLIVKPQSNWLKP